MKELDDRTKRLLKEVVDHFDKEDVAVRERQIRTWRRLKLFWESFHRAWYSEVAHDWRIWDDTQGDDTDQAYYDKPINVFRGYLESIIAALSVTVPGIKCYPEDADDTLDLITAKAGDKIHQLIKNHNDSNLLWLHALFIFCTEGLVACYSYPREDEKYGMYEKKEYEEVPEDTELVKCPNCGFVIQESPVSQIPPMMDPAMTDPMSMMGLDQTMGQMNPMTPNSDIIDLQEDEFMPYQQSEPELCPACGSMIFPEISQETFVTTRLVGITKHPKTRICLEAYGGLNVKVPNYARKQEDCPYLIYAYETHYANVIEKYMHIHGKFNKEKIQKIRDGVGPQDPYEQWGRLNPQYQGEYPMNTITVRNAWLRPAAFNVLNEDDMKDLRKQFPKGVKVVLANDEFCDACEEILDDCWTLTYNPLSDYLHHDPLGLLLVSVQEITNDLISLIVQTVEHGIGQTFADPGVLNFNAYRQMESIPGGIYEAKPKSGQTVGNAFHEVKTATLSPEVMPFALHIQTLAQFVSGALPSLFGGALQGTETASEYSMSRNQALQRLQNVWKIFTSWWRQIFGKVIPMYINEMKDDEKFVQRDKDGNFFNIFIRRAELEGKIGKVELEAAENLPMTWQQQKDVIMQLLNAANPEILAIIGSPENLPVMRDAIGLTDFFIPGEDDRDKQYDEIKILLNSEPIPTGDPMMPEISSVEVDPIYDNHGIEFEIVRKWAISEAGRQTKTDNPPGYKNVLLHGYMHYQQVQQQQMMAQPQEDSGANTSKGSDKNQGEAPITGEQNVATV